MFDGFEIDVLSLGDADCILFSRWYPQGVFRVLVDGGKGSDYPLVKSFLQQYAPGGIQHVVCSHLHNDHAAGLIKLVEDPAIGIGAGWMHNIRQHVAADVLRRAMSGNSADADGVRQVVDNTDRLLSAFSKRSIAPNQPFVGADPAILGPTREYYRELVRECTQEGAIAPIARPAWGLGGMEAALAGVNPLGVSPFPARTRSLFSAIPPSVSLPPLSRPGLRGLLDRAAVKSNPKTQPYNNTSVILGFSHLGKKILFTADAGCDALRRIPVGWENVYALQVPHHGSDDNLSKDLIERFRPQIAFVSARGDESHPGSAVRNGLITVGSTFYSTHYPHPTNMLFTMGSVPPRLGYGPLTPMKKSGVAAYASQRA